MIVGACRDVDPTPADALKRALAELAREPVTLTVPLAGLAEEDVARFIALAAPAAGSGELGAAVYAETEGNPLFVGEIVRLLGREGQLAESGSAPLAIPHSVRETIGRRLRHLSDDEQRPAHAGLGARARVRPQRPGARQRARARRRAGGARRGDGGARGLRGAGRDQPHALRPRPDPRRRLSPPDQGAPDRAAPPRRRGAGGHPRRRAGPASRRARAPLLRGRRLGPRRSTTPRRAGARAVAQLAYEEAVRLYALALAALDAGGAATAAERAELLLALGDAQGRRGDDAAREGDVPASGGRGARGRARRAARPRRRRLRRTVPVDARAGRRPPRPAPRGRARRRRHGRQRAARPAALAPGRGAPPRPDPRAPRAADGGGDPDGAQDRRPDHDRVRADRRRVRAARAAHRSRAAGQRGRDRHARDRRGRPRAAVRRPRARVLGLVGARRPRSPRARAGGDDPRRRGSPAARAAVDARRGARDARARPGPSSPRRRR